MNKKTYIKPTIQEVTIQMNDLCAGSQNAKIPLVIKQVEKKKTFSRRFDKGKTGPWDPEF